MRNLKLTTPRLIGPDVSDWQQFLAGQGLYNDIVDGVFGPGTSQATKDYQKSAGIAPDGIVGPSTLARAVRDGFQTTRRTMMAGMDASVNCTDFANCIVAAGMQFVARYYSRIGPSKILTPVEASALSAAGLKLVVVYQDRQNDAKFFSGALGTSSAQKALELAAQAGQPEGSAIYFAVDFDPDSATVQGPIAEYFYAVNQVFGAAETSYSIGVYGSSLTCSLIRDASLAQYAWLCGSTGYRETALFRPRAHLIQSAPERKICGGKLSIDDDIAQTEDYGAFTL